MASPPVGCVRWGIVGCGAVTEVKSGPGFQRAAGSSLVAVMRRDGRAAEDYARRHGVPSWTDDARRLIEDPQVDAVYIATPPGAHAELALAACAAGKPTYVEKPMARSHAECEQMVGAFAAAGVPLFVAYYRRALDRFRRVAALLAEGEIGSALGVVYRYSAPRARDLDRRSIPWRLVAEHSGGGLLLDLGSHTLDILDFVFGPLADASGTARNVGTPCDVEDTVALSFTTASGVTGTAHWSFAAAEPVDRLEIVGTDGEIALSTFGDAPIRLRGRAGERRLDVPNPPHIQQPLIQTIVDELLDRGRCPSTGVSAARTSAIMDRALDSYYGGRDDAFWLRPDSWPGRRRT